MGKSLFQISDELDAILNDIEEAGGEITEEQLNQLNLTEQDLSTKVDDYCNAITMLKSEEECAKLEKKRLNDRQNAKKNLIEKLKERLLYATIKFGNLGKSGNKVFESNNHKLFTKSLSTLVVNEERFNLLARHTKNYLIELMQQGILQTGQNIDVEGMLAAINAIIKSEQEGDFVPFTIQDLCSINFKFQYIIDFNSLITSSNLDKILELMLSPRAILDYEPISYIKDAIIAKKVNNEEDCYTIGRVEDKQSLTIR